MRDKIKLIGLIIILLFGFNFNSKSQDGSSCIESNPFCSDQSYNFPNATSGSAPNGPDYGCLLSQPNPIWYHLQIDQSGPLELTLSQTGTDWFGIY